MQLYLQKGLLITIITLLMALHHTQDGFYTFLDVTTRTTVFSGTLPTLNAPMKSHLSLG